MKININVLIGCRDELFKCLCSMGKNFTFHRSSFDYSPNYDCVLKHFKLLAHLLFANILCMIKLQKDSGQNETASRNLEFGENPVLSFYNKRFGLTCN